ncbi:MAG: hypothetical protein QXS63_05740, partial [Zestosphaera sp.]
MSSPIKILLIYIRKLVDLARALKCVDRLIDYLGASIRVSITTSSESVCAEVSGVRDPQEIVEVVRKHGGCRILSEDPLKVVSTDGEIVVSAEPENLLAR